MTFIDTVDHRQFVVRLNKEIIAFSSGLLGGVRKVGVLSAFKTYGGDYEVIEESLVEDKYIFVVTGDNETLNYIVELVA